MKPTALALFLSASLISALSASAKTILPDACGDNKVTFDVKTEKDQPAPDAPPAGKAQIVFVEDQNKRADSFTFLTVRYGVDGAWAGANYGNSYFTQTVAPGTHHLCASAQGDKHMVEMASFTAEPGKVYYFGAEIAVTGGRRGGFVDGASGPGVTSAGGGFIPRERADKSFSLTQLSDDEGKFRVKAWKLATWKSKD